MSRVCQHCGAEFRYPSGLRRHQAAKRKCVPAHYDAATEDTSKPHECQFCKKRFTERRTLRRHIQGACRIAPNAKNGNTGLELLFERTLARYEQQLERLEDENRAMSEKVARLEAGAGAGRAPAVAVSGEGSTGILADNGAHVGDNIQIVVNVFGSEDVTHITPVRIRAILDEAMTRAAPRLPVGPTAPAGAAASGDTAGPAGAAAEALLSTALLIYSDPEHPENLTCYMPRSLGTDALVKSADGWEIRKKSVVLSDMAGRALDQLFDKQPYDNASQYGDLMRELRDREARFRAGETLKPVLVKNKELLENVLGGLEM